MFATLALGGHARDTQEAIDKEFWETVAQFDKNLHDYTLASTTLEHLRNLAGKLQYRLAKTAILLRDIQFIKVYGSFEQYSKFLNDNLTALPKSHYDYLGIYSEQVINSRMFLDSTDETSYEWLKPNEIDGQKSFYLALNLFLAPTADNFELLENHCRTECNFSIYHQAKMKFFKSKRELVELKRYSEKLFKQVVNREVLINDYFFTSYLLAYLSYVLAQEGDSDAATFLFNEAISGINKNSFVDKMVNEIVSSDGD